MTGVSMIQSSVSFIIFNLGGGAKFWKETRVLSAVYTVTTVYHQLEPIWFHKGVLLLFTDVIVTVYESCGKMESAWRS